MTPTERLSGPDDSAVEHSATLALDELIRARRAAGERVLHLGFGEAGLPVIPELREVLAGAAGENGYGPVAGSERARTAVAGWFERRGLPTDPEQVLLGPGSKALLFALVRVLEGDVVLPAPSWVSYAAQAALAGKRVLRVPAPRGAGGLPDPEALELALGEASGRGLRPGVLVVTTPDNPTGTVPSASLVARVCEIAERHRLAVISDEIYRDLAFEPEALTSPARLLPETTIVTGGLSKSMALGGWRIGFARRPPGELGRRLHERLLGVASEIWSSLAAPMQAALAWAMAEPSPVREHIYASRVLHRTVVEAVHMEFEEAGINCPSPQGGFYLYPDLESLRPQLQARGVASGAQLAQWLLAEHGVAVLAGAAFGDEEAALRFRVATSLLYGDTESQRWQALRSPDPLRLPWIAESMTHLREAVNSLHAI